MAFLKSKVGNVVSAAKNAIETVDTQLRPAKAETARDECQSAQIRSSIAVYHGEITDITTEMRDEDVWLHTMCTCAKTGDEGRAYSLIMSLDSDPEALKERINSTDEDGLTPLHYAARYNHLPIIELLVENEAEIEIDACDNAEWLTPLNYAAKHNWEKKQSVKQKIENVAKDVLSAVKTAQEKSETLTSAKADISKFAGGILHTVQEKSDTLKSAKAEISKVAGGIVSAVKTVQKTVKELDDAEQSSRNMSLDDNTNDPSPTHSAINYLVSKGANINDSDEYFRTPLHYAAKHGNKKACNQLLRYKNIKIEAGDHEGMTPLHMASESNHIKIVDILIKAGADLCSNAGIYTPLHAACFTGNLDIVQALFQAGAEKQDCIQKMVTNRDIDGNTCLSLAVENGHYKVVKVCLENGSDVNTHNINLMYPVHYASINGDMRIMRMMDKAIKRTDVKDNTKATPLHKACQHSKLDVVKFLIKRLDIPENKITPLLMAAISGHTATIDYLVKECDNLVKDRDNLVKDRDYLVKDRDYLVKNRADVLNTVYFASEKNMLPALEALLKNPLVAKAVTESDQSDNDPLRIAARNGYLRICKCLLGHGAKHRTDNEGVTPLHLAAKSGKMNVTRTLAGIDKVDVNAQDNNLNTPLHLAALAGHAKVVDTLIKMGADVTTRNKALRTPMECAVANGWIRTAKVLFETVDPEIYKDKDNPAKTTPLHFAVKYGHTEMVGLLIDWGADLKQRDSDGYNCLDLAIDNNMESTALAIVKSEHWKESLRNSTPISDGRYDTPIRKLIRKMPDVAKEVFNRCITENRESGTESKDYQITFNYEFLDDVYSVLCWKQNGNSSPYDENDKLNDNARPYTTASGTFKENHPLNIMATSRREDLLAHPLVTALLRKKWNSFARTFYYVNFFIYVIYLAFLTGYIVVTDAPYKNGTQNCEDAAAAGKEQAPLAKLGKFAIIGLASWNLFREVLQLYNAKLNYLSWENLIEWNIYVNSVLLVLDFTECQKETGNRMEWQWNVGTVAIFLAWINLVLFAQKFPRFGIYVLMFTDILQTFFQFFVVFILFIFAFAIAFYALLQEQEPFGTVWQSLIKTTVMMIGELNFDDIFYGDNDKAYLEVLSYVMFCIFMVVMSIIVMNLLDVGGISVRLGAPKPDLIPPATCVADATKAVGLAVDDIKDFQEQAELTRKVMQVELALDVERLVFDCIRRRLIVREDILKPNAGLDKYEFFSKTFGLVSYGLTAQNIKKALDPESDELKRIGEMQTKVNNLCVNNSEMKARLTNVEALIKQHMTAQGTSLQDEDD